MGERVGANVGTGVAAGADAGVGISASRDAGYAKQLWIDRATRNPIWFSTLIYLRILFTAVAIPYSVASLVFSPWLFISSSLHGIADFAYVRPVTHAGYSARCARETGRTGPSTCVL